ncbi:MAG: DUF493 domain-containing protein [Bacteroidetes bacterium]|nr:DUF493 domain-containing protein [Bacteroidota bacterium]MBS1541390.1 DUF493 domain-containing protein [Bacteroidota bacterium]
MKPWEESLREKLDRFYSWPSLYTFKFIVPSAKVEEVKRLFPAHEVTEKISEKGNYTSVTIQIMATNSDNIIEAYQSVAGIEGIIAL